MQKTAIKKMELINSISKLPAQKVDDVEKFINDILRELKLKPAKPVSLKGIWKNKGFEDIPNLESEVKSVHKELEKSILNREI